MSPEAHTHNSCDRDPGLTHLEPASGPLWARKHRTLCLVFPRAHCISRRHPGRSLGRRRPSGRWPAARLESLDLFRGHPIQSVVNGPIPELLHHPYITYGGVTMAQTASCLPEGTHSACRSGKRVISYADVGQLILAGDPNSSCWVT